MPIKNSVGFIQTSNNKYIILLDRITNKWMFPGGMVDSRKDIRYDKKLKTSRISLFKTFSREYNEETGYELPQLRNIYRNIGSKDINYFDYGGHTRIYYAQISTSTVNYHDTNETKGIAYASEKEIIRLANMNQFKFVHSFFCYINLIKT
jgi:8-oxo-dGTP pyrophosphatase MutT (NUDIX family)